MVDHPMPAEEKFVHMRVLDENIQPMMTIESNLKESHCRNATIANKEIVGLIASISFDEAYFQICTLI